MSERLLSSLDIPAQEFIATEQGRALLVGEVYPFGLEPMDIQDVVGDFAHNPGAIDEIFEPYEQIGAGTMSRVYLLGQSVGSVAVKVSTPQTVRGESTSERPIAPEDLITQVQLMNALRHHFQVKTDGLITAPEHYLGLRVDETHSLTIMQYMRGWMDMARWSKEQGFDDNKRARIFLLVNDRIVEAVEDGPFENAIDDLFKVGNADNEFFGDGMRDDNVLIRSNAASRLMPSEPLCVIDQPPPFPKLIEAAKLAANTYSGPGYDQRYIRE